MAENHSEPELFNIREVPNSQDICLQHQDIYQLQLEASQQPIQSSCYLTSYENMQDFTTYVNIIFCLFLYVQTIRMDPV